LVVHLGVLDCDRKRTSRSGVRNLRNAGVRLVSDGGRISGRDRCLAARAVGGLAAIAGDSATDRSLTVGGDLITVNLIAVGSLPPVLAIATPSLLVVFDCLVTVGPPPAA
jgi:hypothetical protein